MEVDLVPYRWELEAEMGVSREERPSRGGPVRRDDPVVRPRALAESAKEGTEGPDLREDVPRGDGVDDEPASAGPVRDNRRHRDGGRDGKELVHRRRPESVRQEAELDVREVRAEGECEEAALRRAVDGGPRLRPVVQEPELEREVPGRRLGDPRIDSGSVGGEGLERRVG